MAKPKGREPGIKRLETLRDRFKKRRTKQNVQYNHPITGERMRGSEFDAYLTHQAIIESRKRKK